MFLNRNINILNNFNQNLLVVSFFIIYLLIGISIVEDYGIAFDENMQRDLAQNRIDYISAFISQIFFSSDKQFNNTILKWPEYGVAFELPILWFEKILRITDIQSQYFFRHYMIFIASFFGSIFFYFLVLKRFKSWKIALLGTLFLITSPRIFSASFYNSKDIIFMYLFVINIFLSIFFIERPKYKYALLLSIVSALCIGTRVLGIIVPFLTLFFILIKYLRNDYNFKIFKIVMLFLISLIFFVILFWPSLWESPLKNFIHALMSFRTYDHNMFNFYLGKYTHSTTPHWYYLPLWIFITTPVIVLFFFIYGFFLSFRRIFIRIGNILPDKKLNDLWRGSSELQDVIFFSLVFVPIFLLIIFGSTLYSGWRHLYFIYPYMILISLYGLKIIYIKLIRHKNYLAKNLLNLIIFFFISSNFYWLYKGHPFQNCYFNFFAGKNPHNNFQVDSWGLTNKFVLEKILKDDKNNKIIISAISDTQLGQNFNILREGQRKRLKYSGFLEENDYIINNNIFLSGDYKQIKRIPNNFEIYYQLFVDDILLTTIYKRSDS